MRQIKGKHGGGTLNILEKGETANPNGRPPKLFSTIKAQGFKKAQIEECFRSLLALTLDELKEVYDNPETTMLEKVVANAIRVSINRGNMDAVETILNRVDGRPTAKHELTGGDGAPLAPISLIVGDTETRKEVQKLLDGGK